VPSLNHRAIGAESGRTPHDCSQVGAYVYGPILRENPLCGHLTKFWGLYTAVI